MKVTLCKTNNGDGFKIAVGDAWLYTKEAYLLKVIRGESRSCQFRSIESEPVSSPYNAYDEEEAQKELDIFN